MLAKLAHLLHLPPLVTYILALSALVLGAVLFGFILHRLFHRLARHLKGVAGELTIEVLEYLVLPLVVVGALSLAVRLLELPSHYQGIASKGIYAVILVVVFNLLSRAVALFLRSLANRDSAFVRITQPAILAERVILAFLALTIFLENLGVSLTAVWTTLGVGSVAIGLALQATLSNLFAGITILADQPVSPGDHIMLGTGGPGMEGEVVRIGWRATELQTPTHETVFIPNSMLSTLALINFSLQGAGSSVSIPLKLNSTTDVDAAEATLKDVVKVVRSSLQLPPDPPPEVTVTSDFTDNFLHLTLRVQSAKLSDRERLASALRKEITSRFRHGELKGPYLQSTT
jgi:small-conductance mechanosensitive channel